MKTLLIFCLLLITLDLYAQKDTLKVDLGKYGFVQIGDKLFKLETTVSEVKLGWGPISYRMIYQDMRGNILKLDSNMINTFPPSTVKIIPNSPFIPMVNKQYQSK